MSVGSPRRRQPRYWKDVMAAVVTLIAVAGFAGFVVLMTILLTNNSTSMSEVAWARYVYLLTGVETLTFTAVGWLFGKEVHREQAESAQRQAAEAMDLMKESRKETIMMVQETMGQIKEIQKDAVTVMHDAMQMMSPSPGGRTTFIHLATAANTTNNYTDIDHPSTNGHPSALVMVTPNWSPGGSGNTYNNHPVGVWYHDEKWSIFNQDRAAMPLGAAFNVLVIEQP